MKILILGLLLAVPVTKNPENLILESVVKDLQTVAREDQCYTRYVWITDSDYESLQASALTMNYISRNTVPIRPTPVAKNLLRINLRYYVKSDAELKEYSDIWEEYRFEPRLNLLITKDTLKFAGVTGVSFEDTLVDCEPYVQDGVKYSQRWQKADSLVRVIGQHVDPGLIAEAIELTGSQAPVVSHRYFITRALTAVQGEGDFKTIYGGLYYRFKKIGKGFKKGTDEDNFLQDRGIGNIDKGITAEKIFADLQSDQRVAQYRSNVTGLPRRVDVFKSLTGRENQGLCSFTHDLQKGDIDIGTHPIMNLLKFKDRAREVIVEAPNLLHEFALFNDKGELQEQVPDKVAADTTIPSPNGTILQPPISCIRCHAGEGGWRVAPNDVKILLKDDLDIFDDLTSKNAVSQIVSKYGGDLELKVFPRGRDDYANGILQSTGPWKGTKDQTDTVKISGRKLAQLFGSYNYDLVYEKDAVSDLGLVGKLRVPPFFRVVVDRTVRVREDPRISALSRGLGIVRSDYDLIYSFMAARVVRK